MTLIMQIALWLSTTFGVPIPDTALPDDACGSAVATSGTAASTECSTENRNMRKTWRIYNGF